MKTIDPNSHSATQTAKNPWHAPRYTPPTTSGNAALVLRAQAAFTGTDTMTDGATSFVSFDREGLALGLLTTMSGAGGALIPLHDATSNITRTRCLQITNIGNVSVQQPSTLAACS